MPTIDILRTSCRIWTSAIVLTALLGGGGTTLAADSPCAEATQDMLTSPPGTRMTFVRSWLETDCAEVPDLLWSAVEEGTWPNNIVLPDDRTLILSGLVENGHERAQKIVVSILETGKWPNEGTLYPAQGVNLVKSLHGSLDSYNIRLLLDIYEQIASIGVREAVVQTLAGSEFPEARLPALDAYWQADPTLHTAGKAALVTWSKDSAQAQLLWAVEALKPGPILSWAKRLADENKVAAVQKAIDAKGTKD